MPDLSLDILWPGMIAFAILVLSDYALTIACASLYQKHVRATIVFEGSYEITPRYQRDIDALKLVSPRLVFSLAVYLILLALAWRFVRASFPQLYSFVLGGTIACLATAQQHRELAWKASSDHQDSASAPASS